MCNANDQVAMEIAMSHRASGSLVAGVLMRESRWQSLLERGFFPLVPAQGVSFVKLSSPVSRTVLQSLDILVHKVC